MKEPEAGYDEGFLLGKRRGKAVEASRDKARDTRGRSDGMGWDFPFVHLAIDGDGWRVGGHPATTCPFCGTRLPETEIDPDASGRFGEIDDCGHCMSCGRRYCGLCKPPSARFRIKEAG